jgi:hypothetical protein
MLLAIPTEGTDGTASAGSRGGGRQMTLRR